MEIGQFIKLLKRNIGLIVLLVFLGVTIALIYSFLRTRLYSLEFSFLFDKKGLEQSQAFRYDGFYTIEAVGELSKFLKEYFSLNEVRIKLFDKYKNNLKAIKVWAPAKGLVKFKILLKDKALSEELIQTLRIESNLALNNLRGDDQSEVFYQVLNSEPLIKKQKGNFSYNTIIFGLVAFIFSLLIILIKESSSYENRS